MDNDDIKEWVGVMFLVIVLVYAGIAVVAAILWLMSLPLAAIGYVISFLAGTSLSYWGCLLVGMGTTLIFGLLRGLVKSVRK